jgi:hypothetical protein
MVQILSRAPLPVKLVDLQSLFISICNDHSLLDVIHTLESGNVCCNGVLCTKQSRDTRDISVRDDQWLHAWDEHR